MGQIDSSLSTTTLTNPEFPAQLFGRPAYNYACHTCDTLLYRRRTPHQCNLQSRYTWCSIRPQTDQTPQFLLLSLCSVASLYCTTRLPHPSCTLVWNDVENGYLQNIFFKIATRQSPKLRQYCPCHQSPIYESKAFGDYFVYAPSQWKTTLQCVVGSHWLGTCIEWSLHLCNQAWASCQIFKIVGCACAGNAANVFPATAG